MVSCRRAHIPSLRRSFCLICWADWGWWQPVSSWTLSKYEWFNLDLMYFLVLSIIESVNNAVFQSVLITIGSTMVQWWDQMVIAWYFDVQKSYIFLDMCHGSAMIFIEVPWSMCNCSILVWACYYYIHIPWYAHVTSEISWYTCLKIWYYRFFKFILLVDKCWSI